MWGGGERGRGGVGGVGVCGGGCVGGGGGGSFVDSEVQCGRLAMRPGLRHYRCLDKRGV